MHRHEHLWMHGHHWSHAVQSWEPGMLLATLSTVLWIVFFIGLAWALLEWIIPHVVSELNDIFGEAPADPPAPEILRQRYAAGEIDDVTFERMRERLEASYPHDERQGAT